MQSPVAQSTLDSFTVENPCFITAITLVEFSWTLRRKSGLSVETALTVIRHLVETESIEFDDSEGVVRALAFAEEGADFADALINSTMEQFGAAETVTFDKSASDRLGWRLLGA
ncbi:MAG: PIN domain-containing protein [Microbacterium sp.]